MTFLWMVAGAVLGGWLSWVVFDESVGMVGLVFGLVCGLLFGRTVKLGQRIGLLEAQLKALATKSTAVDAGQPASLATALPADTEPRTDTPAVVVAPAPMAALSAAAPVVDPGTVSTGSPTPLRDSTPALDEAPPRSPVERASSPPHDDNVVFMRIKRWLSEGNPLVKAGVVVVFFGVAYLFKYAADQGWLTVPIEFRLLGVAIVTLAALVFAWRKRESHRSFALSLQGGAIGVLILTIFTAYHAYALLPPLFAFALLVIVVAGAGLLAVLQDALALAVLAIVGGFLAPILVSTGNGNHVALFSYYAVLNAAIFFIAWIKPWRVLNLVGFVFTFGVGTLWGALRYRPEQFASTEPFLLLFFAFYLLLPLLYALRQTEETREPGSSPRQVLIDGSLVFGTPLIAFGLQTVLLDYARMPLAFSAIGAAAIYTLLAAAEIRRWQQRLLGESHALLAIGFATIAVPLALSAQATTCTFALEGAALVWLGLRQARRLPRWIGYALQVAAGCIFLDSFGVVDSVTPLLNGIFFGAAILALAGLATARLLYRRDARAPVAVAFLIWGGLWWYTAGGHEIARFAAFERRWDWWLGFFSISALIAIEAARRLSWRELLVPVTATIVLGLPFIGLTTIDHHGPLEGWHLIAWALWFAAILRALPAIAVADLRGACILHSLFLWICALMLSAELGHLGEDHLHIGDVWLALTMLAPLAALFLLVLRRAPPVRWPLIDAADRLRTPLLGSLAVVMGIVWLIGLIREGRPTPLPYLPVINPLELAQISWLVLLALWYRQAQTEGKVFLDAELRARVLAVAALVLLTSITLRSVHFFGGVAWDASMSTSPLAQSALSIVWTLAGIVAMLLGKSRGSRAVWFGGAALMALVLVKLMLIDRNHLNDLSAIVGVLVVGVLLVAVGYFAPVPPKPTAGEKA
jgi:uncharacterized membrane protein